MNLLQNLLTNITEPLRTSTTYVAQPRFNGNIEEHYRLPIWSEDVENIKSDTHAEYIAYDAELSTDWQTPLEITPTVRKLIDMVLDEDAGWIVNTDSLRRYDKHAIEVVSTNLSTNETSVCATSCSFNYFNEDIILFRPLVQDYDKPCKETTPLTYASPEEERAFETLDSTLQAKKARETSIATSADSQRPTLRDQLAMAALPGLIAEYPGINKLPLTLAQHTHNAYVCADEMLEARKS